MVNPSALVPINATPQSNQLTTPATGGEGKPSVEVSAPQPPTQPNPKETLEPPAVLAQLNQLNLINNPNTVNVYQLSGILDKLNPTTLEHVISEQKLESAHRREMESIVTRGYISQMREGMRYGGTVAVIGVLGSAVGGAIAFWNGHLITGGIFTGLSLLTGLARLFVNAHKPETPPPNSPGK